MNLPGSFASRAWWACSVIFGVAIFMRCYHPISIMNVGLDPSWELALSEAAEKHLAFGRDIAFTFGPLGYLIGDVSLPSTLLQRELYQAAIAIFVALLSAWHFVAARTTFQKLVFVPLLLIITQARQEVDALSMLVLLLAWTAPPFREKVVSPRWALALGVFSGLVSLTKFTSGLASFAGGLLVVGVKALEARRNPTDLKESIRAVAVFVVGFLALGCPMLAAASYGADFSDGLGAVALASAIWYSLAPSRASRSAFAAGACCAAGLALAGSTRDYFRASLAFSSGYSAAMSTMGAVWQLGVALTLAGVMAVLLVGNRRALTTAVALALASSVFLNFKEGFVRQDGHVLAFFFECVAVATLVFARAENLRLAGAALLGVAISLFAAQAALRSLYPAAPALVNALDPRLLLANAARAFAPPPSAEALQLTFDSGLNPDRLPSAATHVLSGGTVDVLPMETSVVFANGFNWQPAPVFQTYAAYTPLLDHLNAASEAQRGADHILWSWAAIDGRGPLWDEPAAFREIACRYRVDERSPQPVTTTGGLSFLVLARGGERCSAVHASTAQASWGVPLAIPSEAGALTFAAIDLRYSVRGKLLDSLYRVPPIYVKIEGDAGRSDTLRLVGEVANDGILVSPLPRNLAELHSLLAGGELDRPRSMTLETEAPWYFKPNPKVTFETIAYH